MEITIILVGFLLLCYFLNRLRGSRGKLQHLNGPRQWPLVGNFLQLAHGHTRLTFNNWAEEFGPIYRVKILRDEFIVLSDYEHIRDVLLSTSTTFAGRPYMFRLHSIVGDSGINSMHPNAAWKRQRQLGQRALKQFGEGLKRIEEVNMRLLEEMLAHFSALREKPTNPKEVIYETALKSITTFILGKQVETTDPVFHILREFEQTFRRALSASPQYAILDQLPFLVHFPLKAGRDIHKTMRLMDEAWAEIWPQLQNDKDTLSFLNLAADSEADGKSMTSDSGTQLAEPDARELCLTMITAGHTTTTTSLHALLNILAHRPAIQDRIWSELTAVCPRDGFIKMADKKLLPYAQATLLELFRYFTVSPLGLPRRAVVTASVKGATIPKMSPF